MTTIDANYHYNKNLKELARNLKKGSTLPEVILWNKVLRKKQLCGYAFLRQQPLGNYIVDFFCKDLKLMIEVDGRIHQFQRNKDKQRETNIREMGYSVIRFGNEEILQGLPNVIRALEEFVEELEKRKSGKEDIITL